VHIASAVLALKGASTCPLHTVRFGIAFGDPLLRHGRRIRRGRFGNARGRWLAEDWLYA
jgi:hypothetical protein